MFREPIFDKIKLPAVAIILALLLGLTAYAAVDLPDSNTPGNIEVTLKSDETGQSIQDGTFTLYQVGDVVQDDWNYSFKLTETFEGSGVSLDNLDSDGDPELAKTLADYADEQNLHGETADVKDGTVTFNGLGNGLYLLVQTEASTGYYAVNPFLVSVPYYDTVSKKYIYNINSLPKTEPVPELHYDFFELEEWIVPEDEGEHIGDEHPEDYWDKDEGAYELDWVEMEMNTTLPVIPIDMLENDSVVMTFHHQLDSGLELNTDLNTFKVYIGNTEITGYDSCTINPLVAYNINPLSSHIMSAAVLNPVVSIIQTYSDSEDDGCDFHVIVNLSELYSDGTIKAEDLGSTAVRVFFNVELDDDVDIQNEYTSYARYDVDVVDPTTGEAILSWASTGWAEVKLYTFEILIYKYDIDTNEPIAGATFGVYGDAECQNLVSRGGETFTGTSGSDGYINFIGLGDGTYYIKEITAPSGYKQGDEVETRVLNITTTPDHISTYEYGNTKSTSSSTSGGTHHSSGGGGGGGSSSGSGGSGVGGPGSGDDGSEGDDDGIWNILPLPQTGQGWALMIAICAIIVAGVGLIIAYTVRRKN